MSRDGAALADGLVDAALTVLRQAAGSQALALLVDPTLCDPFSRVEDERGGPGGLPAPFSELPKHLSAVEGLVHMEPLRLEHQDFDQRRWPYLIVLPSEPACEGLLNASVRAALAETQGQVAEHYRGRALCGWQVLEPSDEPLGVRARHCARAWVRAAKLRRPNGEAGYLRVWDPRVAAHLPRVLNADHARALQPAAHGWYWLDIEGRIRLDGLGELSTGPEPAPSAVPAVTLTEWDALRRIASINTLQGVAQTLGVPLPERSWAELDRALLRCHRLGFETDQDALVFGTAWLTVHPAFDSHPEVADALRKARSTGQGAAAGLAAFDDAAWARIGQTLNSTRLVPA